MWSYETELSVNIILNTNIPELENYFFIMIHLIEITVM